MFHIFPRNFPDKQVLILEHLRFFMMPPQRKLVSMLGNVVVFTTGHSNDGNPDCSWGFVGVVIFR